MSASVGSLELKKFDMRSIVYDPNENKGPVIVMIGRRDTGKSVLVRDLLFFHQDIHIGTVISGTEAGNGFYCLIFNNRWISLYVLIQFNRHREILIFIGQFQILIFFYFEFIKLSIPVRFGPFDI
jgi:hypothetical protein